MKPQFWALPPLGAACPARRILFYQFFRNRIRFQPAHGAHGEHGIKQVGVIFHFPLPGNCWHGPIMQWLAQKGEQND
jgi:hypothetical protein